MAGHLTAVAVRNAKPSTTRRELSDGAGLFLVVQPSGEKSWAFRYRTKDGRTRKLTIGKADRVTLEVARVKARKASNDVDEDRDPAAEKVATRAAAKVTDDNRVENVVSSFIERHAKEKTREATWRESQRILEREIVSRWRGQPLTKVRTSDIHKIVDAIMDRGKPAAALRSLQAIRPFFKWAVRRKIITTDPCEGVDAPSTPQARDRVLSDPELKAVWAAAQGMGYPFGPLVHLIILLGQRRDEVAELTFNELDLDTGEWTLPATRAKNNKPHHVPLPPFAVDIIRAIPSLDGPKGYLFTTTGKTPVSGFGKAKATLDRRITAGGFRMDPWTFHDLRRTHATGCARLGVPPHVVEAILNHRSGTIRGVAAVYNRYDHASEKRAALDQWADHVRAIVT